MRASTLFILALAVLLGVGTVFAVKHFGLLNNKSGNGGEKREEYPYVLIAQTNLFQGTTPTAANVKLRQMSAEEFKAKKHVRDKMLAPYPEAVQHRILRKNVPVGEILMQEYFEDLKLAPKLTDKMAPDKVAVYLELPKAQAAGGILQVDEYVDVILTATVCYDRDCQMREELTAPIALGLRVIGKRDSIWTTLQAPTNTVTYNLEATPFRAALIEYAKRNGVISLMPAKSGSMGGPMMDSKDEMTKSIMFHTGGLHVGRETLMEIFKIKPKVKQIRQQVLGPAPPKREFFEVEIYTGHHLKGTVYLPKARVGPNGQIFASPTQPLQGESPAPPLQGAPAGAAPPGESEVNIGGGGGSTARALPMGNMDEPMEAFVQFRNPGACETLPQSSKKG